VGFVLLVAMVLLGFEAVQLLRPAGADATRPQTIATPPSTGVLPGAAGLGPVTNLPGDLGSVIQQAIVATGVPASWYAGLAYIQSKENAGGSPTIQNPCGVIASDPNHCHPEGEHATGIMQMLPSTFRAFAVPGHTDITNPLDNVIASIRYIQARYGSPSNTPWLTGGQSY
jgi:hypothetical protein